MKIWRRLLTGILIGTVLTVSVQAGRLSESFETVAGTTDGSGDFDPAPDANPWGNVSEYSPTYLQVVHDLAETPLGDQYLRIQNYSGTYYEPWIHPCQGVMSWEFMAKHTGITGLDLQFGKRINNTINVGMLNMRWNNGDIQRFAEGSFGEPRGWNTIITFTPGQWEKYRVELNYVWNEARGHATFTHFDFYVNDSPVATDMLVTNPTVHMLNNIYFGLRSSASTYYMDGINATWSPTQADYNADGRVDIIDFGILSSIWLSEEGDPGWNPDRDINIPPDGVIDILDFYMFLYPSYYPFYQDVWLAGTE